MNLESPSGFSRVPYTVWADRRLNDFEVRVYTALVADCWETNTSERTARLIGKSIGKSHTAVNTVLARLCSLGLIERLPIRRGQGIRFKILSPVFGPKKTILRTALGMESVAVETLPARRAAKVCGKCNAPGHIGSSGVCERCLYEYGKRMASA